MLQRVHLLSAYNVTTDEFLHGGLVVFERVFISVCLCVPACDQALRYLSDDGSSMIAAKVSSGLMTDLGQWLQS